jgi:uncharacterized damage-inducible protein DinB
MMLGKEMLTTMFAYNSARNERILDCAARLTDAQLDAPTGYGHGSIRKTLWHMLIVEYGWRSFLLGVDARKLPPPVPPTGSVAEFQAFRRDESERARAYVADLDEEGLVAPTGFMIPGASGGALVVWQILMHILTHSAQHRSELALWLTQHGQSPGDIDFLFYMEDALAQS